MVECESRSPQQPPRAWPWKVLRTAKREPRLATQEVCGQTGGWKRIFKKRNKKKAKTKHGMERTKSKVRLKSLTFASSDGKVLPLQPWRMFLLFSVTNESEPHSVGWISGPEFEFILFHGESNDLLPSPPRKPEPNK
ncbi:hypothetical protein Tco_1523537 [Tanacetum coccineum]